MKTSPNSPGLELWPLFRNLSAEQIRILRGRMLPQRVPPRTHVLRRGEHSQALFLVLGGTVKVTCGRTGGTRVTFGLLGQGAIIGELSAMDGKCHSADVVAIETCLLLSLRNDDVHLYMRSMPQLLRNLNELVCHRVRVASQLSEILAIKDLSCRVAHLLSILAEAHGHGDTGPVRIPIRLTQNDLAEWVGSSRERVNRALTELRKERLIAMESGYRIVVLDSNALAKRCGLSDTAAGTTPAAGTALAAEAPRKIVRKDISLKL